MRYFCSYMWANADSHGFGNIVFDSGVKPDDDMIEFQKLLKEDVNRENPDQDIVLLFYKQLKENENDKG